jgi:ATP-dependent Lon protease
MHVTEGATPKDGRSSGITIATAILSVFTGRKVRKDVAMTGEITLRGKVLPIGGLKEKALAARRIGIKNIIIPTANEKDIEDIPETVRKDITFIPVEEASEVFAVALVKCDGFDGFNGGLKMPRVTPVKNVSTGEVCCKE